MKIVGYIAVFTFFLSLGSVISVVKLLGSKRHVVVQLRHPHGAVVIHSKKVRVPYTLEQTAIPTHTKGPFEFLFLKDGEISFATAFSQLAMCVVFGLICCLGLKNNVNDSYRRALFKALFIAICVFVFSEFAANAITHAWLINTKNGINGAPGNIFGGNATFPNQNQGELMLKDRLDPYLFITPVFALMLIIIDTYKRQQEELTEYLKQQHLQ